MTVDECIAQDEELLQKNFGKRHRPCKVLGKRSEGLRSEAASVLLVNFNKSQMPFPTICLYT